MPGARHSIMSGNRTPTQPRGSPVGSSDSPIMLARWASDGDFCQDRSRMPRACRNRSHRDAHNRDHDRSRLTSAWLQLGRSAKDRAGCMSMSRAASCCSASTPAASTAWRSRASNSASRPTEANNALPSPMDRGKAIVAPARPPVRSSSRPVLRFSALDVDGVFNSTVFGVRSHFGLQ